MAWMHAGPSAEKHAFWVPFITYETFCKTPGSGCAALYTNQNVLGDVE